MWSVSLPNIEGIAWMEKEWQSYNENVTLAYKIYKVGQCDLHSLTNQDIDVVFLPAKYDKDCLKGTGMTGLLWENRTLTHKSHNVGHTDLLFLHSP